ncbi:alpha/beta hydrolase [Schaalia sp. Marseille-Q2122]|uniref:alpha/beta hydrolase n=1 Tax=Schaalia sp. Marseille-Q2122 TaxID=2736604 RepID=UPI001589DB3A|nr:alpha/beta hydrolase [Schaalia sp. Marseille-Q2122]
MVSLTWSDVKLWAPSALEHASYDVRGVRSLLEGACDDLEGGRRRFISQGEAPDAIRKASKQLIDSTSNLVADTSELMMACAEACDGVWQVQTKVMDCEQLAQVSGVYLDPVTGHVDERLEELVSSSSSPDEDYFLHEKMAFRRQAGADLRQMVADTLALAGQVDADFARRLAAVERGVSISSHASASAREGADARSQGLADLPDPSWSSTEVSLWWSSMSDTEKQWLVDHHPEAIGNLDGVEFSWRDKANRARIDRELEAAQKEYDAAKAEYDAARREYRNKRIKEEGGDITSFTRPKLDPPSRERFTLAEGRLNDLKAVKRQFSSPEAKTLSLLTLDTSGGRLRAAVGIGDVDKADHVGVFVPGMGTRVDSKLEQYVADSKRLKDSAGRALMLEGQSSDSVAMVAWLGYDAPAEFADPGWQTVLDTDAAKAGAERLSSFTAGIETTRVASGTTGAHLTVLGHSYGSTTAGIAADHAMTNTIDDLVLFASPGAGVRDTELYNLDSCQPHVSGVDSEDWVQGLGSRFHPDDFGGNPVDMPGFKHLSNVAPDPDGWGFFARHGTEIYLAEGSETLRDMGRVIGGTKR